MNRITTLIGCSVIAASSAAAEPYCSEFLSPADMPRKYQRLAPVLSSAETGWIFTSDQFETDYTLKREAAGLIGEITGAFTARGMALAILIPPPRPVIAGQETLDATGGTSGFSTDTAAASFSAMIGQIRETGAIAPDLQAILLNDPALRAAYYYQRDTHWTPVGATVSAMALARMVSDQQPGLFPSAGTVVPSLGDKAETLEEPGSLSEMVRNVCGVEPAPEIAKIPIFDLPSTGLLGDTASLPKVALLGTSFSDRRKRDYYRVADAVAGAFQASVENYSVSGGGATGAMEAFVLSGAFEAAEHDLVIWELPYTEAFQSISALRQILGALSYGQSEPDGQQARLDASGRSVVAVDGQPTDLVAISTPEGTPERMTLTLTFEGGGETSIKLRRKGNFPPDLIAREAAISLADHPMGRVVGIEAQYDIASTGESAFLELRSLE